MLARRLKCEMARTTHDLITTLVRVARDISVTSFEVFNNKAARERIMRN